MCKGWLKRSLQTPLSQCPWLCWTCIRAHCHWSFKRTRHFLNHCILRKLSHVLELCIFDRTCTFKKFTFSWEWAFESSAFFLIRFCRPCILMTTALFPNISVDLRTCHSWSHWHKVRHCCGSRPCPALMHTVHPGYFTSPSTAEDPRFESCLRQDFSGLSHFSDFKIGTPLANLPYAWRVIGSALGLVGPVSVYCDWVR